MVRKIGDDGKLTNDGTFYEYLKDIGCPAIRGEYIGGIFLIFLAHIPFFALNSILINAVEFTNNSISKIVLVIIALVLGYLFQGLTLLFYFSLISRRLLDMGITAKLWVVAMIPVIGFVFSIVLAFFVSNDRKVTKTTIEKNEEMGILYMVVFLFISPLIYTFSFWISINWAEWILRTLQSPKMFIFALLVFVFLIMGLLRILGARLSDKAWKYSFYSTLLFIFILVFFR